ncbi:MAG: ribonuclease [Thermoleophilia bacterium]|nr:ribonuclease [Thermoleophilia bacterium]
MHELLEDLPEDLRLRALTHPAFATSRAESFERLEFLGDSVLGLAITDGLFERYPELPEGELTRLRAAVVSRESCAEVARANGLGAAMVEIAAARGTAHQASAERLAEQRNALAALTEGVIGASFLTLGYAAVAPRVLAVFEDRIAYALENRIDARSQLQELASRAGADVTWDELGEDGPPHDRTFTVSVKLAGMARATGTDGTVDGDASMNELRASGSGRSKQEAQQAAAAALLALMDRDQG